jgi:hypothetical protein
VAAPAAAKPTQNKTRSNPDYAMRQICATILAAAAVGSSFTCSSGDPSGLEPAEECHKQGEPCSTTGDCCILSKHSRCRKTVCKEGACGFDVVDQHNQIPGDCVEMVCFDDGSPGLASDPADTPDDGNPCTTDFCRGDIASYSGTPRGTSPDGIGFCDGLHKIDCLTSDDCDDASLVCSAAGKCVPPWCVNGSVDMARGETDIDCGGSCDPCIVGRRCSAGTDCIEGVCGPGKICSEARCDDGTKNGEETGIDCGQVACKTECKDGEGCHWAADCKSSVCIVGTCQTPTCVDGAPNGREEGWDCGGPDCPPCE